MKKIIYDVRIVTTNISANLDGYFDSKEEVEKEVARVKSLIEQYPDHYGKWEECSVEISEINVTNELSQ